MDKRNLYNAIVNKIKKDNHVSFVEIEKIFESYAFEYKGTRWVEINGFKNLTAWIEWNLEAIELIESILKFENIALQGCDPKIYLVDGKYLNLEVAKSCRSYKERRWYPCFFVIAD